MTRVTDVRPIGPLKPFVCLYRSEDWRPMGITLWATDEQVLIRNQAETLPELRIDGVLCGTAPAGGGARC